MDNDKEGKSYIFISSFPPHVAEDDMHPLKNTRSSHSLHNSDAGIAWEKLPLSSLKDSITRQSRKSEIIFTFTTSQKDEEVDELPGGSFIFKVALPFSSSYLDQKISWCTA